MQAKGFQTAVSVTLGTLFGILAGLPMIASQGAPSANLGFLPLLETLAFALFGAFVGWRRRTSSGFYYFCIAGILILAVLNARALQG